HPWRRSARRSGVLRAGAPRRPRRGPPAGPRSPSSAAGPLGSTGHLPHGTGPARPRRRARRRDRKSTRLNSSHVAISYAVFCLKHHSRPRALPPFPTRRSSDLSPLAPVRAAIWSASRRCAAASSARPARRSKVAIFGSRPTRFHRSPASRDWASPPAQTRSAARSEEHTSELQSRGHLVCRLLLETPLPPPSSPPFPYTTLFRSVTLGAGPRGDLECFAQVRRGVLGAARPQVQGRHLRQQAH